MQPVPLNNNPIRTDISIDSLSRLIDNVHAKVAILRSPTGYRIWTFKIFGKMN